MKRISRMFSLLLCLAVSLCTLTTYAAIPAQNEGGLTLPYYCEVNKISYGYAGANGTYTTPVDDEMGSLHRWTTAANASYSRLLFSLALPTKTPDIKAGDKFYISFYYRINNSETDPAVTGSADMFRMTNLMHDYKAGSTLDVNAGEWAYHEEIVNTNARNWNDICLYFELNGLDNKVCSIDFAALKGVYLGAATDDDSGTVLEQMKATMSDDSSIKSIKVGNQEIDLTQNPNFYSVIGTPEGIAKSVEVTPNSASATVKTKVEENLCIITVFSERANLITPVAGTYTEYYIECEVPEVNISENEGKGLRAAYSGLFVVEGENVERVPYEDEKFGTVYRYGMEYTTRFRWPKFDLAFELAEERNVTADEYVYFSYYWRNNTVAEDSKVTAIPNYINRSSQVRGLANNVDIGHNTKGTMNPGEWHREEYIVPMGSASENLTGLAAKFQFGIPEEEGKYVSFDFANPECYFLGNVSYYDGAPEDEFSNAVIGKLKSYFTANTEITRLSVGSKELDLTANPTSYVMNGSLSLIDKSLVIATGEVGAYTAVTHPSDSMLKITVFPHTADMRTAEASQCRTYTISVPVTVDDYTLTYNSETVTDFSALEAGVYTLTAQMKNNSGTPVVGTFLMAAFDAEGTLIGTGTGTQSELIQNGGNGALDVSVTTAEAPKYFIVFLWDSVSGMRPIMDTLRIGNRGITY